MLGGVHDGTGWIRSHSYFLSETLVETEQSEWCLGRLSGPVFTVSPDSLPHKCSTVKAEKEEEDEEEEVNGDVTVEKQPV